MYLAAALISWLLSTVLAIVQDQLEARANRHVPSQNTLAQSWKSRMNPVVARAAFHMRSKLSHAVRRMATPSHW